MNSYSQLFIALKTECIEGHYETNSHFKILVAFVCCTYMHTIYVYSNTSQNESIYHFQINFSLKRIVSLPDDWTTSEVGSRGAEKSHNEDSRWKKKYVHSMMKILDFFADNDK